MKTYFYKGFTSYGQEYSEGLVIVTPHSGPALDNPVSRDDSCDTVASLCWKNMGGRLILGNISRDRLLGVDFNRDIPSLNIALDNYEDFLIGMDNEKINEYKKKYAWVSKNEEDYYYKLRIYQQFWGEVGKGKDIILLHKANNKIAIVPSIMDVVAFTEKGFKKKTIKNAIRYVNAQYYDFLEKVHTDYKNAILVETKRYLMSLIRRYKTLDLRKVNPNANERLIGDLKNIVKYAPGDLVHDLKYSFTPQSYVKAVKGALDNTPVPEITIENTFTGSKAFGPKRKLFSYKNKVVLEVEGSQFINFWYPHIAAKIIEDILNLVKGS